MRWREKRRRAKEWEIHASRHRAAAEERRRLLVGQESLVEWLEHLLFFSDPIGINFETNADEYRSEAESIVLRVHEADSIAVLRRIIHEEFVRWFDEQLAGPPDRYEHVAHALWERLAARNQETRRPLT